VSAARAGDVETAARCKLALLGITRPSPEQVAGATLEAHFADDVRVMRVVYVKG